MPSRRRLSALDLINSGFKWIFVLAAVFAPSLATENPDTYFAEQPQSEPYYVTEGQQGPWLKCRIRPKYATDNKYSPQWVKLVGSNNIRIISLDDILKIPSQYTLDRQSASTGTYNLRINVVDFREDNAKFYCQLSGPGGLVVDSRPAEVVVLVRPNPPTITEQPNEPIAEGQFATAQCQTTGGNPVPKIRWMFTNGTSAQDHWVKVEEAEEPHQATSSRISFPVSAEDHGSSLECHVWNEALGENSEWMKAKTTKLNVEFRPRVKVGPLPIYNVERNSRASLSCEAVANPPVYEYRWEQTVNVAGSPNVLPPQQNVSFKADSTTEGSYTCTATNRLGVGTGTVQLNVQYAPQVNVPTSMQVREGESLQLKCNVRAKPEAYSIRWEGPKGLTGDSDVYILENTAKTDRGNYTCTAKNRLRLFGIGEIERMGFAVTTVEVIYPPGPAKIQFSRGPVEVGNSVTIYCTNDDPGYPKPRYRWKSPGALDFEPDYRPAGYMIDNVQLSHAGAYWCRAENDAGIGRATSKTLNVIDPAKIYQFLLANEQRDENSHGGQFFCAASGQPQPEITWWKNGKQLSSDNHLSINSRVAAPGCEANPTRCRINITSTLSWRDLVRWDDKGTYICRASNGASKPHESVMELQVFHRPYILIDKQNPEEMLAAANLNEMARIACPASANPRPVFRWYKDAMEIFDGSEYSMEPAREESGNVYKEALLVRSVREGNYGDYLCRVSNDKGTDEVKIRLQIRTIPNAPRNLQVPEASYDSLSVTWNPGFDGGYQQTFFLEYQLLNPLTGKPVPDTTKQIQMMQNRNVRRRRRELRLGRDRTKMTRVIEDLAPINSYQIRIKSQNQLGPTQWSQWVTGLTADVPQDPGMTRPTKAQYDTGSATLQFEPSLDMARFCIMIYMKRSDGQWRTFDCLGGYQGRVESVPRADEYRVAYCTINQKPKKCSKALDVVVAAQLTSAPWNIVVPLAVVGVFVLVITLVVCLCCCLRKHPNSITVKDSSGAKTKVSKEERKHQQQIKSISQPYKPEVKDHHHHQQIIGSQDSGVFTMDYRPNLQHQHFPSNGHHIGFNGNGMRPDYGDEADDMIDDHDRTTPPDHHDQMFPDEADATLFPPHPIMHPPHHDFDSYTPAGIHPMVDMNPVGSTPMKNDDLNSQLSGYSTPTSRRVLREIIV